MQEWHILRDLGSELIKVFVKQVLVFSIWYDILYFDLVKSWSCKIGCWDDYIAVKFGRPLSSVNTEVPKHYRANEEFLHMNLRASRLGKVLFDGFIGSADDW